MWCHHFPWDFTSGTKQSPPNHTFVESPWSPRLENAALPFTLQVLFCLCLWLHAIVLWGIIASYPLHGKYHAPLFVSVLQVTRLTVTGYLQSICLGPATLKEETLFEVVHACTHATFLQVHNSNTTPPLAYI